MSTDVIRFAVNFDRYSIISILSNTSDEYVYITPIVLYLVTMHDKPSQGDMSKYTNVFSTTDMKLLYPCKIVLQRKMYSCISNVLILKECKYNLVYSLC